MTVDWLALYEAAVAVVTAAGLGYLLYADRFAVTYSRFFRGLVVGLLAFAGVTLVHAVLPGIGPVQWLVGLFVLPSLFDLVRRELVGDRSETLGWLT